MEGDRLAVHNTRMDSGYHPGGATPRFWKPTTPPTNCRPEALGGGILGGAPGRAVPWGGVGGTSEQLGMRPRCDPIVRTAPSHNRG